MPDSAHLEETEPGDYYIPVRGKALQTISEMQSALGMASPHQVMIKGCTVLRKLIEMMDKDGCITVVNHDSGIFPPETLTIQLTEAKP